MAPFTSMFYFGENTDRPTGEWRKQVLKKFHLFLVSQEILNNPLHDDALQLDKLTTDHGTLSIVEDAIIDPAMNRLHQALAPRHKGREREERCCTG